MSTLSLGSAAQFDSSAAGVKSIARLTDTKFVIAFSDEDDSNKGKVVIGTISGTTVTIVDDSAVTFEAGQATMIEIKRINDTTFIIVYKYASVANKIQSIAGSVSGTTITLGSMIVADEEAYNGVRSCGVAVLDETYVVFAFLQDRKLMGRLASISGTTITLAGSKTDLVLISSNNGYFVRTATLDSARVLFAYVDIPSGSDVAYLVAVSVDTSAKTLTPGSKTLGFQSDYSLYEELSVDTFDDRYYLLGQGINVAGGEVVGTTITAGAMIKVNDTEDTSVAKPIVFCLDSTHWGVAYYNRNDHKGKVTVGTHSAKVLTRDIQATDIETDPTTLICACKMTSQLFAVAYKETP